MVGKVGSRALAATSIRAVLISTYYIHAGFQKLRTSRCQNKTSLQPLFLGESQVRSAPPWLPLRRSALWPHPRVQPPPASWPWPSLAMGSSRALTCAGCKVAGSHHPRALSGRAEKPIRGSEAALRSVSYPLLILPPPVLFSTTNVHRRLFVTLAKLKRGRGHILMYTTTSPYKQVLSVLSLDQSSRLYIY